MKKRILSVLTLLCMVTALLSANMITVSAYTGTKYGNYLYYTISDGEVTITDCDSSATTIEIPSVIDGYPVTSIAEEAFYNCSRLTSITIYNGVTNIDHRAFYGCSNLTSISIPDSVTNIGGYAFSNTGFYNNASNWDNDVLYIGNHLIKAKDSLSGEYTVKNGTKCISDGAFSYCWDLTSITIPDSITSIGNEAFSSCSSLSSITIPNSVTNIGDSAFSACRSLTSVTIPDSVTSIGGYAFYNCSGLTSITIGNGVTSIGDSAFGNCGNLTKINWNAKNVTDFSYIDFLFPNVGTDGDGIDVVFGDNVEHIPAYLFQCSDITSVTIGKNVTSIGDGAFYDCSRLTSIIISNSVTNIGDSAFSNCKSLTSITIPDSVTSIGGYAFYNCSGLTSINVDKNNTNYCSVDGNLFNKEKTALMQYAAGKTDTQYAIPDSVMLVNSFAFYGCDKLSSITIHNNVKNIAPYAFFNCRGLKNISVDKDNTNYCSIDGSLFNKEKTALMQYAVGKTDTQYAIPNTVTEIQGGSFQGSASLKSITIPNNVKLIGNQAFCNCTSLTHITLPNSVTNIGNNAFSDCSSLTNVTIGNNVVSIGNGAFASCSSLTSIAIPDSVTSVGKWTFSDCSSLTNVTIGNNVVSIGNGAFSGCKSLTSIAIPDSVTSIGKWAFNGCSDLTNIYYTGTEDEWNNILIGEGNYYLTNANRTYITKPEKKTKTTVTEDSKAFTVTPINIKNGSTVILALYNGEEFVTMQSAVYSGKDIPFTVTDDYTTAKVMVWDSLENMTPICEPEIVK